MKFGGNPSKESQRISVRALQRIFKIRADPRKTGLIACFFVALLALCWLSLHWSNAWSDEISLPSGARLKIAEIEYSRVLPHAFYDQALASLPRLYPEHSLLVGRRYCNLGDVAYAVICYRETPSSPTVTIQALATHSGKAWRLETSAPSSYAETLVQLLEITARLPSQKPGHR